MELTDATVQALALLYLDERSSRMKDGRNTKSIPELIQEFSGLENIVSKLRQANTGNVALADVPPEILEGYVAFGALMCYVANHGDHKGVNELETAWASLAPTLGESAEAPAEAGAAG